MKRIVILGGQSEGFGFGLNDDETFAAVAARSSCGPVEVHDVALIGTVNPVTWDIYKRRMAEQLKEDHFILALFWHPEQDSAVPFTDYHAVMPPSAVLDGWNFDVPRNLPKPLRSVHALVRSMQTARSAGGWLARTFEAVRPISDASAANGRGGPEDMPKPKDALPGRDFIRAVAEWAARRGAKFSVVLLPNVQGDGSVLEGLDGIRVLDLDAAAKAEGVVRPGWLLPDLAHYGVETAAFLGERLGREICDVDFPDAGERDSVASAARR